jgi:hypothetical protein
MIPPVMLVIPPHVQDVCRINRGAAKCRYLLQNGMGRYECGKLNAGLKTVLDRRVREGTLKATGDHCPGRTAELLNRPNPV